jgi:hypothetical protein
MAGLMKLPLQFSAVAAAGTGRRFRQGPGLLVESHRLVPDSTLSNCCRDASTDSLQEELRDQNAISCI